MEIAGRGRQGPKTFQAASGVSMKKGRILGDRIENQLLWLTVLEEIREVSTTLAPVLELPPGLR